LWQARHVAKLLTKHYPDIDVELVPLSTRGDEILDRSLQKVGGKGLFIKELEQAMLDGKADIAVHSMKDMPGEMPEGFCIAAVLARAEPYDALLAHNNYQLFDLPKNAVVGTSSLRRAAQLLAHRPDLKIKGLRGNVETRISKWQSGDYDAIVLAQAGLVRLGLQHHISQVLAPELSLPAVAQGIIGIECLLEADETKNILKKLNNHRSEIVLRAERSFNFLLGGDCHTPIAAFAQIEQRNLCLTAVVAAEDGSKVVRVEESVVLSNTDLQRNAAVDLQIANDLGQRVGEQAVELGAKSLLSNTY